MYEEVEINTPLELARYLVNEGDLYVSNPKVRLTATNTDAEDLVPFRYERKDGQLMGMIGFWQADLHVYYKKLPWHDRIPEGRKVPCYVSDRTVVPDECDQKAYVSHYDPKDSSPYLLISGGRKKYATPIPADELWVPEL